MLNLLSYYNLRSCECLNENFVMLEHFFGVTHFSGCIFVILKAEKKERERAQPFFHISLLSLFRQQINKWNDENVFFKNCFVEILLQLRMNKVDILKYDCFEEKYFLKLCDLYCPYSKGSSTLTFSLYAPSSIQKRFL